MRRSRLFLLSTAALTATAALTVPTFADGTLPPDRSFTTTVVDAKAMNVAEPSIEVGPDNALYITGPQGLGGVRAPMQVPDPLDSVSSGGDILWRSDDGGATWKYLQSYDGTLGGGDSDIAAAPDGRLFASGLTLACVSESTSSDRGESWTTDPVGCTTGGGLDDRQWNDVDNNNAVVTSFGSLTGLQFTRSIVRNGVVVNGPTLAVDGGDNYQWPGVVSVDQRTGTSYVVWNTDNDDSINDCDSTDPKASCQPADAENTDDIRIAAVPSGASASRPFVTVASQRDDTFDSFVDVDVDTAGGIYVVWTERHPDVQETWTMLSASHDGGYNWSAPVKVNATPKTTVFPWVSAGDPGRVAVSYYGTDATGLSPEVVAGNPNWYVYSAFSTDGGQTFSEYQETPTAIHQGAICTSGTGCATGTRDLLDFFETDYDANGCLVTAYADNSHDTVDATGKRVDDQPTVVSFARQTSGPGLLSTTDCTPSGVQPL